ncbi:hypothetical protein, partial [Lysobacter xanthus]
MRRIPAPLPACLLLAIAMLGGCAQIPPPETGSRPGTAVAPATPTGVVRTDPQQARVREAYAILDDLRNATGRVVRKARATGSPG